MSARRTKWTVSVSLFSLFQLLKTMLAMYSFLLRWRKKRYVIKEQQLWFFYVTEKRKYVNKSCYILNPCVLTVLLSIPFNKLPCLLSVSSSFGVVSSALSVSLLWFLTNYEFSTMFCVLIRNYFTDLQFRN